jgi:hypothetical protein
MPPGSAPSDTDVPRSNRPNYTEQNRPDFPCHPHHRKIFFTPADQAADSPREGLNPPLVVE